MIGAEAQVLRFNPRGPAAERGFTLIELMLAVSVTAMVVSLVWSSFSLTARNKQRGEEQAGRYHQVRLALHRMAREISMAYLSRNDQPGTTNPRTMFVGLKSGHGHDLLFSAFAHMRLSEDAKESDQSLIRYYLVPDREQRGSYKLMRRETRRLGVEKPGEQGPAYVLLEDIEELSVEYFDGVADEWRESWSTTAADGQPDRLPTKVRIVMTVRDMGGGELTVRTATRTHLTDPLVFSK